MVKSIVILLCIVTAIISYKPTAAIKCYCNEPWCSENEICTTEDTDDAQCYKSARLAKEENRYVTQGQRFGCMSGGEDSVMSLQCHVNTKLFTEPVYMSCCNHYDGCNLDLPDPNENDDPRWADADKEKVDPEQQVPLFRPLEIGAIVMLAAFISALTVSFIIKGRRKKNLKAISQSTIYDSNFVERLKIHAAENNSPPSTHTYTISDISSLKSDSPCEQSCGSIEHTSTLPDLTSGAGTRVLEERTMARNIGSKFMLPVGSGRHGRVFMGEYHFNKVAVKAFRSIDADSWRREETILRKLRHENVVRWIASETVSMDDYITETWMIIEYCPYGSLCDFLDHYEISNPVQAVKIVHSIIQGINYLHEDLYRAGGKPPVAHRDIKSRNILMRTPEICCIADFGHAVIKIDDKSIDFGGNNRIQVGTVRYMAPEVLKPEDLDITKFYTFAQTDLYQFALVLWEVAQRTRINATYPSGLHRLPYDGVVTQNPNLDDMIKIVCELEYRPPVLAHWQQDPTMRRLSSLMVECWRPKPDARMETLGVMKQILDLYEQLHPQHMYNHIM